MTAWQRLAPTPPVDRSLDDILAAVASYLDEPDTTAALDKAEAAREYPHGLLAALRARGLAELLVPQRATSPHLGALNVMLARRSGSLAITVGVNALALLPVYLGGTDEQCRRVDERVRAGAAAAMLLTELEHGSNLIRTRAAARSDGDGWRLSGEKHLINGGREHDLLVALLRTGESPPDRPMAVLRDFSMFLVERDSTVTALPRWRTLPARAADISGVRFDGTWVPGDALIGRKGQGFALVQRTLCLSHGGIAALASGAVSGALEVTLAHGRERNIYGSPIIALGAIAQHCTRMAALDVVVAALAVKATWLANLLGPAAGYFTAAAKYACCLLAEKAVDEGRRVLGARALLEELPYARFVRDVLLYGVFDGTSHVMLEDLSRYVPRLAEPAERGDAAATLRAAYSAAPRTIRSTAEQPWQPYAPALHGRCLDLAEAVPDATTSRLVELADTLGAAVRAVRATGQWETDQAVRFEAAGAAAELEALLAAAELTLTGSGPDADATRYAVSWWGDGLAARLERLIAVGASC
jgi:alkylation response protein AidB-like acyl-CoA dehydrogenase